jgi:hypothetical protein
MVFLAALLLGYALTLALTKEASSYAATASSTFETEVFSPVIPDLPKAPEYEAPPEPMIKDKADLGIKLQTIGEGFHGDQVVAKNGETWLGFYRDAGRFYLRNTKVRVRWAYDPIVDGEEGGKISGKSVFVKNNDRALFIVKNAKRLNEGNVKTVFYGGIRYDLENQPEAIRLKNGFRKTFEFAGDIYVLKVENKLTSDEYLDKGSKLSLERNGKEQVLRYLPDGCNDCGWTLYWAGDLDQDGKLDFFFDLSDHYNVSDERLYLSSYAPAGQLVKLAADFWTNGC